jgi:UDP-N-acetyl-D-glucosamine dehydrogenase
MPEYVVRRTSMALNDRGKAVKDSNILLLGLAYKADVDDVRESPTFALLDRFANLGAQVSYYDPHVPGIGPTRQYARWRGVSSAAWCREVVERQDAVVIVTNHAAVDWNSLAAWASLIIDTRNAMHGISGSAHVVKA